MKNQKSTANKDLSPKDRYDQDPQFKALVDILGALIRQARFTATELREAVKLAASRSSNSQSPQQEPVNDLTFRASGFPGFRVETGLLPAPR